MPSRFDPDSVHYGYMQGLRGVAPEANDFSTDYDLAWLIGDEDRTAGKKAIGFGYVSDDVLPVKPGDTVTIPKGTIVKTVGKDPKPAGRTYKVRVDHLLPGSNAYFDWRREFVRPTGAKVRWAGAGGYWSEVDLSSVVKEPSDA